MTYSKEQIAEIQAKEHFRDNARFHLRKALKKVLNSPEHEGLCNYSKAEILLDLENNGEYDPLG